MRRLILTLTVVFALFAVAAPTSIAAPGGGVIGTQVDIGDGGAGCPNGTIRHEYKWKWHAYLDGGGYWYLWADVYLCTAQGWQYVGGFRA